MGLMPASTLGLVLTDTLAACVAAFAAPNTPVIPTRHYITHGQPVAAQEQLTVQSLGIAADHPFPLAQIRAVKSSVVAGAGLSVEIWRSCWPAADVSNPRATLPAPNKLQAAALILAQDAAALYGFFCDGAAAGTLFPSLPLIRVADDVSLSPLVPLGPQGLLAGWRFGLAVKLTTIPAP